MPQWSDYTNGERIKILRGRQIRQADLAEMTGLSVVTIQKAEQDKALSLPTLMALADALSVDTSVILGQQAPRRPMNQQDRTMVRALSRAVHDTAADILPDAEPITADELRKITDRGWSLAWAGHYSEAGTLAAPLITSAARYLHDRPAGEECDAWAILTGAFRLAAHVANLMGARDLAYAAITEAHKSAQRTQDDTQHALVAGGRAWVCLRDARLTEALRLAEESAVSIEPKFSRATPTQLVVYGSHVNFAAVVASRMGNEDGVADYLSQSHAVGARIGQEHRAHGKLFGPTTATTQAVGMAVALRQIGKAMKLLGSIHDVSTLTPAAQARFRMDKALAQAEAGLWDASLDTLEEALTTSAPEWTRHQALPGVIVQKVGNASTARLRRVSELIGMSPVTATGRERRVTGM